MTSKLRRSRFGSVSTRAPGSKWDSKPSQRAAPLAIITSSMRAIDQLRMLPNPIMISRWLRLCIRSCSISLQTRRSKSEQSNQRKPEKFKRFKRLMTSCRPISRIRRILQSVPRGKPNRPLKKSRRLRSRSRLRGINLSWWKSNLNKVSRRSLSKKKRSLGYKKISKIKRLS